MYERLQFYEKMNLLIISLNALNVYRYDRKIFSVQNRGDFGFKYINSTNLQFHIYKLSTTYEIYKLIKQVYLQEITSKILHSYENYNIIKLQYLRRYKYLYERSHSYYYTSSCYNNVSIENNAMINLYIIHQACNNKGLYLLTRYLYK